ncbi:glycoside hydrolase family 5 protein [Athelia psychrophila]|uniref:glucan 1,3-beta-glucosidase n=1 Tax=Athelia psychrophila TaxID=1759441 RepID=A0A166L8F6_9AGAM|nr:glycoside hydrolase family 5 protein [Fibularhizoctonia sp. CBS 109695]
MPIGAEENGKNRSSRRLLLWLTALGALIVAVRVVVLPVYFAVIKKHNSSASASGVASRAGGGGRGSPGISSSKVAITGETGSWYYDPEDLFNKTRRPTLGLRGVNIGGLFVLEPLISPALFQAYPDAIDEWSLSAVIAANTFTTLEAVLKGHHNTFITEKDIAQIAGAGLNWIRVPIPYWAIETWEGEPFLEGVSWKYIVCLLGWARKYGLRSIWICTLFRDRRMVRLIHSFSSPSLLCTFCRRNLDDTDDDAMAAFNHSGKFGIVNFLNGVMGVANAQRALNYIRIITEFISEHEWTDVVPIFGVVNEALLNTIGREQLNSFYLETHNMMRNITGVGAGKGPYMSVHDGFQGVATWAGFMPGSDRVILDSHPYTAFYGSSEATIASGTNPASAGGTWPKTACTKWGNGFNASRSSFGVTIAGEMSAGFNDCGLFLPGDSGNWSSATKAGVMQFTLASMDALQDYFFWTWKEAIANYGRWAQIGNSTAGIVESPLWSYQLGLQEGWIPTDPRTATGGAGAGTISATWSSSYGVYPPATISNAGAAASALPQYTSTGTVATLVPPQTLTASATASAVNAGNGWFDASDTAGGVTAIAGCTYPYAWSAVSAAVPTLCGAKTGAALATPPPKARRESD